MGQWAKELQLAGRTLGRRPGFVAAVVATLALGIGATTAIFSVVDGALLRPLPYPEPERVVTIEGGMADRSPGGFDLNAVNFAGLREGSTTLRHMSLWQGLAANLSGGDRPEHVSGLRVEPGFFEALGVEPVLGRSFGEADGRPGAPGVALLTHELWTARFGADPDVVGREIRLNSRPHTVVGVLPDPFDFPGDQQLFTALAAPTQGSDRSRRVFRGVARLAPGATVESAREELAASYDRLREAHPDLEGRTAWARPLEDLLVTPGQREALMALSWAVLLVLVIACVNVTNLLLVRAETRQREIAVRVALGAGRARLLPHFLSEGLLLSLTGGALGVLLAWGGVDVIAALGAASLPRSDTLRVDATALGFALTLSLAVGVVVSLVPALRLDVDDLQQELRSGGRGSDAGGSGLRNALVVSELALALMLLGGAGLLVNSFHRISRIDVGLEEPDRVLVAGIVLPAATYEDPGERVDFTGELVRRVRELPGVEAAGVTSRLPLFGGSNFGRVEVLGQPDRFAELVEWRVVTPGFFDAVGIELLDGRMLHSGDASADTLRTLLATREFARRLYPEGGAVGRHVDMYGDGVGVEIVGIVSDLRDRGILRGPPPGVYAMHGPATAGTSLYLTIRGRNDPLGLVTDVRRITTELDPDLALHGVQTLDQVFGRHLDGRRFSLVLLATFAGAALLLGSMGIYGVLSYSVAQRTREMGVRLALGAERSHVTTLLLRHGMGLALLGIGLGLLGSVASTRLVESQLFGVESWDPATYLVVVSLLASVSFLAVWIPARRAAATDPSEALRAE